MQNHWTRISLIVACVAFLGSARASTLTWDPGALGPVMGSTGSWNTTDVDWNNGTTDVVWDNTAGSDASFGTPGGTVTLNSDITANSLGFTGGTYTLNGTNTLTLAGTDPLASGFITSSTNTTTNIQAVIAGSIPLTHLGSDLRLSGANTFSGGMVNRSGSVIAASSSVVAGGNITSGPLGTGTFTLGRFFSSNINLLAEQGTTIANPISVASDSLHAYIGGSNADGTSTYTGPITLNGGVNLTADGTHNTIGQSNFSGVISGPGSVTEVGPGIDKLQSDSGNTYVGGTTVSTGYLELQNTTGSATGTGPVVVSSGARLGVTAPVAFGHFDAAVVSGKVTCSGEIDVGSTSDKSNNTLGTGDLTLNSSATYGCVIDGSEILDFPPTSSRIDVTGTVTLGTVTQGPTFFPVVYGAVPYGRFLFPITNDGTDAINGVFKGIPEGSVFTTVDPSDGATYYFLVSYKGDYDNDAFTGGNDMVLQRVVPEPTGTLLAATGLIVLAGRRKTRPPA